MDHPNSLTPALARLLLMQLKIGVAGTQPLWVDQQQHEHYLKHGLEAKKSSTKDKL